MHSMHTLGLIIHAWFIMSNIRHTQHVHSNLHVFHQMLWTSNIFNAFLGPFTSRSWQHAHGWWIINSSQPITKDEKSSWSSCMPHHHFHVYIMQIIHNLHKGKDSVILGIKLTCILPPVGWHFERRLISWSPGPATHRLASACHLNFWSRSRDSVVRSHRFPKLCLKAWTCKSLQAHWRWRGKNESWLHLACKRREASKGERDTKRRGRLFSEAAFQIKRHTMSKYSF